MSKGDRFAYAALGLVAGLAIALLFFVWSVPGFRAPTYEDIAQPNGQSQTYASDYRGLAEGYWRPEFAARDTYAQWAMALFAIVAIGVSIWAVRLLRDTLNATVSAVDAANQANAIMQADQRPWLTIDRKIECDFTLLEKAASCGWQYGLNNRGRLPAQNVRVHQRVVRYDSLFDLSHAFVHFVDTAKGNAPLIGGHVVFPTDRSRDDTLRNASCVTAFSSDGDKYALMACVTYRHSGFEVGVDAQLFHIKTDVPIGPMAHKLIGFGSDHVIE